MFGSSRVVPINSESTGTVSDIEQPPLSIIASGVDIEQAPLPIMANGVDIEQPPLPIMANGVDIEQPPLPIMANGVDIEEPSLTIIASDVEQPSQTLKTIDFPTNVAPSSDDAKFNTKDVIEPANRNNTVVEIEINPVQENTISNPPINPDIIEESLSEKKLSCLSICGRNIAAIIGTFFLTLMLNLTFILHDALVGGLIIGIGASLFGVGVGFAVLHFAVFFIKDIFSSENDRRISSAEFRTNPLWGITFRQEGNYLIMRGVGFDQLNRNTICIGLPEYPSTAQWFVHSDRSGCLPSIKGGSILGACYKSVSIPADLCSSTSKAMGLCAGSSDSSWEIITKSSGRILDLFVITNEFQDVEENRDENGRVRAFGKQVVQPVEKTFHENLADVLNEDRKRLRNEAEEIIKSDTATQDDVDRIRAEKESIDQLIDQYGLVKR